MSYGTELAAARKARGLSQGQLAEIANVSRGTIRNIETAVVEPNWKTRAAIESALDNPTAAASLQVSPVVSDVQVKRIRDALEMFGCFIKADQLRLIIAICVASGIVEAPRATGNEKEGPA